MQEEVNEKTISLCIKGGKITAQILKAALIKLLAEMDKKKKQQEKGKGQCKRTGRQSIKSLQRSGAQITNIVVTDNNIKSFDRVARKYGIDYSLKKVEQEGKTEYLVFFKAKDVDVMTAAFKEYTSETLKKQKRESVRQKLEKVKEELSNHRQLKKEKKREQEPIRSVPLHPQRKGYSETGQYHYRQHKRGRRKIRRGFLGQVRTPALLCTDRLHLV